MTISVRRTTLRDEVVKADPDWVRTRRRILEYEFSNGRQFYALYDERGAYGSVGLEGQWDFTDSDQSGHIFLTAGL